MKPIKLTVHQWINLRSRLRDDYSPSITLIRDTMKRNLGCTPRTHTQYDPLTGHSTIVYLDFFDDTKRTMFLLKYSEYFDASKD